VDEAEECEVKEKEELGTTPLITTTLKVTTTIKLETTTSITERVTSTSSTTTSLLITTTTTTLLGVTSTTILQETDTCAELDCPPGTKFVGSSGGSKYHYCNCSYVKNIIQII
jgi:hypothetical protein